VTSSPYVAAPFLGESVPVELVAELLDARLDGASVTLRCATLRFEPEVADYYGTPCETIVQPPTPGEPATVQLDFCTDAIVRVRYAPGPTVPDVASAMVVGRFADPVPVDMRQDDRSVTLSTALLRVVVSREPWQIEVFDRAGRRVWSTRPLDLPSLRAAEHQWHPWQQRWLFLHRYAYPLGVAREQGRQRAFASFDLQHDEHVFGFGESFGPFDKRGTGQHLWVQETFGNASPASYKPVPFWLSTRGYGQFVHTANATTVNVGDREHTALSLTVNDAAHLDCYLVYGPSLKEILPRYTAITGAPGVPPKWSFGLWMSRITYASQAEVEAVATQLRKRRIPCDVVHVDTGWFEREWACDLRFGASNFPDPAGMLVRLRDQGFRVSLWQWPNLLVGTSLFEEGREGGYLVRRASGHTLTYSGFDEDAGLIDYSNPAAVAWVQRKLQELFGLGVAAIKADFGEGAPAHGVYQGAASAAIHNLYPLLYNRAIADVSQGIIWARSAWAGSQRFPVHWSGDGVARFADLPCVLRSALSFGLSGFPFYSHDIGGFAGVPSPELYVRWAQLGLFSSHSRCHGEPPREPWAYGPEAEAVFRRHAELRYRLLPYLYSEAVECGRSSLPLLRPLVLDFQDDPVAWSIDDQYLFGRNLLVAPILTETNARRVYLPAGPWVDYWSKTLIEGGRWLEVAAPLDTLPLYVRGGAVLPYGPLLQHVDERPLDPLSIEIYAPAASGGYTIHDEGRPDVTVTYERRDRDTLDLHVAGAPGAVEAAVFGADRPYTVRVSRS